MVKSTKKDLKSTPIIVIDVLFYPQKITEKPRYLRHIWHPIANFIKNEMVW